MKDTVADFVHDVDLFLINRGSLIRIALLETKPALDAEDVVLI